MACQIAKTNTEILLGQTKRHRQSRRYSVLSTLQGQGPLHHPARERVQRHLLLLLQKSTVKAKKWMRTAPARLLKICYTLSILDRKPLYQLLERPTNAPRPLLVLTTKATSSYKIPQLLPQVQEMPHRHSRTKQMRQPLWLRHVVAVDVTQLVQLYQNILYVHLLDFQALGMMKECLEHFLVNPSIFQKFVAKALPPNLPRERQIFI
jgi:hypothetical protein